jgi:diaminopimelate decarboxylase
VRRLSVRIVISTTASLGELKSALGNGFAASRIETTGPKSRNFSALCLRHGVLINADDLNELKLIARLAGEITPKTPARVMARINEFFLPGEKFVPKDLVSGSEKPGRRNFLPS